MGLVPFYKRLQGAGFPLPPCKNTRRRLQPGKGTSPDWASSLIWDLLASKIVRNKFLLSRSFPVCNIVLQLHKVMMTGMVLILFKRVNTE